MITLYQDPLSTTSRPVLLFLAEHDLPVELKTISLLNEEQKGPEYTALNPNQAVPFLTDGELAIGECSAILKYLADVAGSPAYPQELKARARVNWAMDWFNTGYSHAMNYSYLYPRLFPHHAFAEPEAQAAVLERGLQEGVRWLSVLDVSILGHGGDWLLGEWITISDYLGSVYVGLSDAIGFDLSPWPNVAAWMRRMRARPAWTPVNSAFDGMVSAMSGQRRAVA